MSELSSAQPGCSTSQVTAPAATSGHTVLRMVAGAQWQWLERNCSAWQRALHRFLTSAEESGYQPSSPTWSVWRSTASSAARAAGFAGWRPASPGTPAGNCQTHQQSSGLRCSRVTAIIIDTPPWREATAVDAVRRDTFLQLHGTSKQLYICGHLSATVPRMHSNQHQQQQMSKAQCQRPWPPHIRMCPGCGRPPAAAAKCPHSMFKSRTKTATAAARTMSRMRSASSSTSSRRLPASKPGVSSMCCSSRPGVATRMFRPVGAKDTV